MSRIFFVTGGARSGKSAHAEKLAASIGAPVIYVATMQPTDEELHARITRHRERRPAAWTTIEEPIDLERRLASCDGEATLLLDCLSLWVSNLLWRSVPDAEAATTSDWEAALQYCLTAAAGLLSAAITRTGALVVVTNEVGLGVVPDNPLSRYYRDALGKTNQVFAGSAEEAFLLVSGIPVRLR